MTLMSGLPTPCPNPHTWYPLWVQILTELKITQCSMKPATQSYLLHTHLAFLIWQHGTGLWMLNAVVCTQGSLRKILRRSQKTGKYATKLKNLGSSDPMKWGSPEL